MIICVCNNVSDRSIRQAVDQGAVTMSALRAELGVGTCCGRCNACAKTVLRECLEQGAAHLHGQPVILHRNAASL